MRNSKNFTFILWLLIFALGLLGSFGLLNNFAALAWCCGAITGGFSIYQSRKIIPLSVVFIFNFLFILYAIPHVFFEVDIVSLSNNIGKPYLAQTLWIISLFTSSIILSFATIRDDGKAVNSFLDFVRVIRIPLFGPGFYILIIALLFSILFLIKGEVVIGAEDGYQNYVDNLNKGSGIQEYLLVVFFWAALLIRTKIHRFVWYLVLAIFLAKLTMLGFRIVALMGFLLGFWFVGLRLSIKQVIFGFIFGFVLFSIAGVLKFSLNADEILASLFFESHGDNLVSHHGNVLWASTMMLSLIDQDILTIYKRIELFGYYALNSLIPSGLLQNFFGQVNLGSWLQENGYSSGGGHVAVYSYVAAGVPGIVVVASLLALGAKISLSNQLGWQYGFVRCWFMMTLVTFPRWVSYDLGNFFFRLPLYASIGYALMLTLSSPKPRVGA